MQKEIQGLQEILMKCSQNLEVENQKTDLLLHSQEKIAPLPRAHLHNRVLPTMSTNRRPMPLNLYQIFLHKLIRKNLKKVC